MKRLRHEPAKNQASTEDGGVVVGYLKALGPGPSPGQRTMTLLGNPLIRLLELRMDTQPSGLPFSLFL